MKDSTVFVVDDDQDMRQSFKWLIESVGLPVEAFVSAEDFLAAYRDDRPGCLLLDVRMPGMGGLRLLERLRELGLCLPVIVITGHAEVWMAVQAMKAGAFDFLEKPVTHQQMLDRIQDALRQDRERRARAVECAAFRQRLALLTQREREVLDRMVRGEPSKAIALEFGLSERTIEKHRENLMHKMEARSLAQLIRGMVEFGREG
ncbi:two component transcriptional regulator, LuxR family [Methylomagnum ishizawai]|uniref:Two component transcriptional regulator, LuxR family n=1 Tax=Methylomagnum ishizawai TaxID=1760988 RepID=A0A1Y6D233_9GAMM|nr:response regulator [Methylomagnum ishizawai]SMF94055.1 two component transcriptional regulator, LuxR family [Methylomagnum ishizawai]